MGDDPRKLVEEVRARTTAAFNQDPTKPVSDGIALSGTLIDTFDATIAPIRESILADEAALVFIGVVRVNGDHKDLAVEVVADRFDDATLIWAVKNRLPEQIASNVFTTLTAAVDMQVKTALEARLAASTDEKGN